MNRYEEIAQKIITKISSGVLQVGQKLPSVRDMSFQEEVAPATIVQAYDILKSRGILESRERAGYFVSLKEIPSITQRKISPSFIPQKETDPDELIRALRMSSHEERIFPFGTASPLPDFFPLKKIQKAMTKVLNEEPHLMSEYRFPPGSLFLREEISSRYNKLGGKISADHVVTTSGAIEAISLALNSVTKAGDVIGIETPTYFGIIQLVRSLGLKAIGIPVHPKHGVSSEGVLEAIKKSQGKLKAIVTVPHFHNPTGALIPDEEKLKIVKVCEAQDITLIEDDIYGDLYFGNSRPRPISCLTKSTNVILCGSFAKTLSPALRVGYAISAKHSAKISLLKSATTSGVSALMEDTLAEFISTRSLDTHLRDLRSSYRQLVSVTTDHVIRLFPKGSRVSEPQGGFVLWVELPKHISGREVQVKALERKISIAPGEIFAPCGSRYQNYLRLNCAIPWSKKSVSALEIIGSIC